MRTKITFPCVIAWVQSWLSVFSLLRVITHTAEWRIWGAMSTKSVFYPDTSVLFLLFNEALSVQVWLGHRELKMLFHLLANHSAGGAGHRASYKDVVKQDKQCSTSWCFLTHKILSATRTFGVLLPSLCCSSSEGRSKFSMLCMVAKIYRIIATRRCQSVFSADKVRFPPGGFRTEPRNFRWGKNTLSGHGP